MKSILVGKVAIKVWPDTSGFREKLRAQIKAEVEGQGVKVPVEFDSLAGMLRVKLGEAQALVDATPVTVTAKVDLDQGSVGKTKAEIQTQLALEDLKASITTRLDKSALVQQVSLAKAYLQDLTVKLKSKLDEAGLIEQVLLAKAYLKDWRVPLTAKLDKAALIDQTLLAKAYLKDWVVKIRAKLETASLVGQLTSATLRDWVIKVKAKFDESAAVRAWLAGKKLMRPYVVEVKSKLHQLSAAVVRMELAKKFRTAKVAVQTFLDKKSVAEVETWLSALSGGRLMKEVYKVDFLKDLDKRLPQLAMMGTFFAQAGSYALHLAGSVLSIGRGIAEIAPAALALPGIFVGLGVSLAATIIAFKDLNKEVPQIAQGFKAIGKATSGAFWEQARKPISELANTWLPLVATGMARVGKAQGQFFGSLATDLKSIVSSRLPEWFGSVASFTDKLRGSTGAIAYLVKSFGDLGSHYMPLMGGWLSKMTNQFSSWLTAAVKSGRAFKWIDTGLVRLHELGQVASGAFRVLDTLSNAAAQGGSTTLKMLGDALQNIAAVMKKPENFYTIATVFQAANTAISNMWTQAGPGLNAFLGMLGDAIPRLLPMIGNMTGALLGALGAMLGSPEAGRGMEAFFNGIRVAIDGLTPTIATLGPAFGSLLELAGLMATQFAPLIRVAFDGAGHMANGLLEALKNVVVELSTGLYAAIDAITPALHKATPALSGFLALAGQVVGATLREGAASLGLGFDRLAEGVKTLERAIAPWAATLKRDLGPILGGIATVLGTLGQAFLVLCSYVVRVASSLGSILLPVLRFFVENLLPMVSGAFMYLIDSLSPLIGAVENLVAAISPVLIPVLQFLAGLVGGALTVVFSVLGGIIQAFAAVINGLASGVSWLCESLGIHLPKATKDASSAVTDANGEMVPKLDGITDATNGITDAMSVMGSATQKRLQQLKGQAAILTGDAKAAVVTNMADMQAGVLAKLSGMTTGSDALLVQMATTANKEMGDLAKTIPTLTGTAKEKALAHLEELRTGYERQFGNLGSIVQAYADGAPAIAATGAQPLTDALTSPATRAADGMKAELARCGLTVAEGMSAATTAANIAAPPLELAIVAPFSDGAVNAGSALAPMGGLVTDALAGATNAANAARPVTADALLAPFSDGMGGIGAQFSTMGPAVDDVLNTAQRAAASEATPTKNALIAPFSDGMNGIGSQFGTMGGKVDGALAAAVGACRNTGPTVKDAIVAPFAQGMQGASGQFSYIQGIVTDGLGKGVAPARSSGRSLMDGFADGIRQAANGAYQAASDAIAAVARLFPHSPAKEGPLSGKGWVLYSGMTIPQAFAAGIEANADLPAKAMDKMMVGAKSTLDVSTTASRKQARSAFTGATTQGNTYHMTMSVQVEDLKELKEVTDYLDAFNRRYRALGGTA